MNLEDEDPDPPSSAVVSSTNTIVSSQSQTTFKLQINADEAWLMRIRESATFAPDSRLDAQAQHAFASTEGPLVACESTHLALKALMAFGLVVKTPLDSSPSSLPIAHYLAESVLNSSKEYKSNLTAIISDGEESKPFDVPRRVFLLREVATLLNISIYVFSARRKARRFVRPDATTTIAFFHSIDSYLSHAEYLILGVSDYPHRAIDPPSSDNSGISWAQYTQYIRCCRVQGQ